MNRPVTQPVWGSAHGAGIGSAIAVRDLVAAFLSGGPHATAAREPAYAPVRADSFALRDPSHSG